MSDITAERALELAYKAVAAYGDYEIQAALRKLAEMIRALQRGGTDNVSGEHIEDPLLYREARILDLTQQLAEMMQEREGIAAQVNAHQCCADVCNLGKEVASILRETDR